MRKPTFVAATTLLRLFARFTKGVAFFAFPAVLAAIFLVSQTAPAQGFITVDYPGAALTTVRQINNNGVMAGRYVDAQNVIHGFVLQNGVFTNIDFPGAQRTAVWGINDNGDLVGRYGEGGRSARILAPPGRVHDHRSTHFRRNVCTWNQQRGSDRGRIRRCRWT